MMFVEFSALFFNDYPGPFLRTFAVEAESTPLVRELRTVERRRAHRHRQVRCGYSAR
jgi:hypothetical protein